jgi:predicted amidohydrolase
VGLNRVGDDGKGISHSGGSRLVDPMGEVLVEADEQEVVLTAIFSKNYLTEIREKLPFLQDRDDFNLIG